MKLYATTTSERASKGQGGNEYINTVITCDEDIVIQARVCSYDEENWRIQITTPEGTSFQTYPKQNINKSKGKQKKDENIEWYEQNTGKSPDCPHYINSDKYNPDGWKFCTQCKKGKQKKGECGAIDCKNPAEHIYKGIAYCDGHYTQIHATE